MHRQPPGIRFHEACHGAHKTGMYITIAFSNVCSTAMQSSVVYVVMLLTVLHRQLLR